MKKQKKRPSTAQSNVGSIKAEPSKKYRRRQRQNKTFTTTVKRRAKTRLEKQEEEAAIKMQTIARGHMARKEVQQKKAEIKSSIQIQKVARARHARKEVAQKRNELDSAKKIQAVVSNGFHVHIHIRRLNLGTSGYGNMYDIANLFDDNVNITRLDTHLNPTTLPYCNLMCLHGCVKLQIFSS